MKIRTLSTLIAVGAAFLITTVASAAPAPDSFADLAESLTPSVVNIATTKTEKFRMPSVPGNRLDPFREFFGDDFFKHFGGQGDENGSRKSQSLGSGFIWDESGYIITNNHVVEGADEIVVRLSEGKKFEAKIVGTDPKTDVAVLKIDPGKYVLKPVKAGDSDVVRVGDWVLAIGNPFGLGHSVTAGIISAKERIIGMGPYDSFLQTDADINFGNSGGPLFDIKGRVIGINAAKNTQGAGIGFTIPINMAKSVITQLKSTGKVTRAWLGVMIQDLTEEISDSLGLGEPTGALVSDVLDKGPAQKSGLERGDVILEFDGKTIKNSKQLPFIVASHAPGAVVEMTILRKGEKKKLTATLGEMEGEAVAAQEVGKQTIGMVVQEITKELRDALNIDTMEGLVITDVEGGSAAQEAGLRRGDIIIEINQTAVSQMKQLQSEIGEAKKSGKGSILLLIKRGENTLFVPVKLPKKEK
jgi:serine protease Do